MKNEIINPDSLFDSVQMGYSQAVKTSNRAFIHCSGQVAWDGEMNLIGGDDIGEQTRQVLRNLRTVVESSGATVSDIISLRTYVVNLNPSLLQPIGKAIGEFYGENIPAANTLIGVQSLALPDFLIEIEAIATI